MTTGLDWQKRVFTFEEVRDALYEAWISWRSPRRVESNRREDLVPEEHRGELPVAPARMIAACLWTGDPYGEPAHPDYEAKLLNALERFRVGGLLTFELQRRANGLPFDEPRDRLYRVAERLA